MQTLTALRYSALSTFLRQISSVFVLLCILVFAALTSHGQTGKWISLGKHNDNVYYMRIDRKSNNNIQQVWVKTVCKVLQTRKNGQKVFIKNGYTIELSEYDCENRRYRLLSFVDYYPAGSVITSVNFESWEQAWENVIPDSVGESLLESICELLSQKEEPVTPQTWEINSQDRRMP